MTDIEQEDERDQAVLQAHVAQLAEHFETVQIIVTRHIPERGGTIKLDVGAGNFYARMASARAWLTFHEDDCAFNIGE